MLPSSILSGLERHQRGDGQGPVLQRQQHADSFTVLDTGNAANVKLEAGTTRDGRCDPRQQQTT